MPKLRAMITHLDLAAGLRLRSAIVRLLWVAASRPRALGSLGLRRHTSPNSLICSSSSLKSTTQTRPSGWLRRRLRVTPLRARSAPRKKRGAMGLCSSASADAGVAAPLEPESNGSEVEASAASADAEAAASSTRTAASSSISLVELGLDGDLHDDLSSAEKKRLQSVLQIGGGAAGDDEADGPRSKRRA